MELGRSTSFLNRRTITGWWSVSLLFFFSLFFPSLGPEFPPVSSTSFPFVSSLSLSDTFGCLSRFLLLSLSPWSYLRGQKYSRRAPPCSAIMPSASTRSLGTVTRIFSSVANFSQSQFSLDPARLLDTTRSLISMGLKFVSTSIRTLVDVSSSLICNLRSTRWNFCSSYRASKINMIIVGINILRIIFNSNINTCVVCNM